MTAILLALAASISYGAADFTGGFTTRRVAPLVVVLLSQLAGLVLLLLLIPVIGLHQFRAADLAWGAGAGIVGGAGVMLLYRALASGRMTVIAPVTALEAAAIPVVFGLVIGERPSGVALSGVVLGFVAVALVSWSSDHPEGRRQGLAQSGVLDALGAGFGFGVFFILLSHAGHGNAMWALLESRWDRSPFRGPAFCCFGRGCAFPTNVRPHRHRGCLRYGSECPLSAGDTLRIALARGSADIDVPGHHRDPGAVRAEGATGTGAAIRSHSGRGLHPDDRQGLMRDWSDHRAESLSCCLEVSCLIVGRLTSHASFDFSSSTMNAALASICQRLRPCTAEVGNA